METEQARMERLWTEVQAQAKVQTGLPVKEIDRWNQLMAGIDAPNMAMNKAYAIGYTTGFGTGRTDEQVKGAMAHELGHFYQGATVSTRQAEAFADKFAVEKGFGDNLLSMFQNLVLSGDRPASQEDKGHPNLHKRIAAIQRWMRKPAPANESQLNLNLAEGEQIAA